MKAVWAAAALMIVTGLFGAYAVTRPHRVWTCEIDHWRGTLPADGSADETRAFLRSALQSAPSAWERGSLTVSLIEETTRGSWRFSWPPLQSDRSIRPRAFGLYLQSECGLWLADDEIIEAKQLSPSREEALERLLQMLTEQICRSP
jgi:hypothetical protein